MKTGYIDRFGKDICVGHKIKPFQEGFYGRLAIIKHSDKGFYVDIPDYTHWNELELDYYIDDRRTSNWEFEIVEE